MEKNVIFYWQVLDVSSVLVFTDGYANRGVTAPAMFSKGIENTLKDLPTCSIYTFGMKAVFMELSVVLLLLVVSLSFVCFC